jgi:hypothetical protein
LTVLLAFDWLMAAVAAQHCHVLRQKRQIIPIKMSDNDADIHDDIKQK